ncbi:hypothetical protein [Oceanidesulfovibrio marinus]|uniref:Uncharacterized protein n=1 Tax=Oceanidesulfovibrio marinus TaxID=370038 RepID=A0ABX6NL32_9BACT|nr:hypothetical protein [Oceanidesulfovibrio marinus]QJT10733.1 hypothetical protein E8L03_18210 [Oceanidesulfovibrio marinus]
MQLNEFLEGQNRGEQQLFGVYQSQAMKSEGKVRLFLWMEGYNCFHRVFIDVPTKAIESVKTVGPKVRYEGEVLELVEINFAEGVDGLFTIHDLFRHLSDNCIIIPGYTEADNKSRKADLVDKAVPRQQGMERKGGLEPFSRPVL